MRNSWVLWVAIGCASCTTLSGPMEAEIPYDPDAPIESGGTFDGIGVWRIPHRIGDGYAFHWAGDLLRVWSATDTHPKLRKLDIEKCKGLAETLSALEQSILPSAEIMSPGRSREVSLDEIWIDAPMYEIKYFPPHLLGSLTLVGADTGDVPWVEHAHRAMELMHECVGNS